MPRYLSNPQGKVHLSLAYDPKNDWVNCIWLGEQNVASVVTGTNACLELLEEHHCCCLLNDNRNIAGFWSDEIIEWMVANWCPRAIQAGLTHMATIVYPESLAAIYEEATRLSMVGRLHMRAFRSLPPAQEWLLARQPEY